MPETLRGVPSMILHTHPVAQTEGLPPRCEANGSRGWRWCCRDATKRVDVARGDGDVEHWLLCTFHANRMVAVGSWRTDIGEDFTVIARFEAAVR